ncbi:hypothetical protein GO986_21250 [Deinococcus sp. HMF7620]|uniref:Uncharacterized protein n=1 Tax=Deinococcus arboris TaxID=2682977 RepID=A0A7C9IF95_9DEIO|nr:MULTISPECIES: hypothetical protein [Deinococcus]MBZ9751076.1 hypothetical protein [Deinococcus betulae]MVN89266.1 hypothetical protein [Deinococcus arboris]
MGRFDYLSKTGKKAKKEAGRKVTPAPDARRTHAPDPVEAVYLRRETVRAVSRALKKGGGESVEELAEDLLLAWLRARS